ILRSDFMATTIKNTELVFNSEKECSKFLDDIYKNKKVPSNSKIANTLAGMKKIKTINVDGVKYEV
ncbi:TPA: hypothetical protein ACH6KL_002385, partial [Enterococcus faecium]